MIDACHHRSQTTTPSTQYKGPNMPKSQLQMASALVAGMNFFTGSQPRKMINECHHRSHTTTRSTQHKGPNMPKPHLQMVLALAAGVFCYRLSAQKGDLRISAAVANHHLWRVGQQRTARYSALFGSQCAKSHLETPAGATGSSAAHQEVRQQVAKPNSSSNRQFCHNHDRSPQRQTMRALPARSKHCHFKSHLVQACIHAGPAHHPCWPREEDANTRVPEPGF